MSVVTPTEGLVQNGPRAQLTVMDVTNDRQSVQHASTRRTFTVNGRRHESDQATLADLLSELGFADTKVATALNGGFVAAPERGRITLADGDKIEIVSARQGG